SAPARRGRLLAMAAACALLAGAVAVLSERSDDDRTRVEVDEDGVALPDLEPGVLRPLGPRDGKDSIRLPVTAEPSTGLRDGDVVHVSAPGFEPGEQVGIVQCAREAGGDSPETRGGVDGCNLGTVEYADADQDGVASGSFTVRRVLTTPLTGTVDCAAEADRCVVGMGAVNDYDRSGGHAIEFAPVDEPVDIPTATVTPTEALADGDLVHVAAEGLTPGSVVSLSVCSSDPQVCWQTGEGIEVTETEGGEEYTNLLVGLRVDGEGRAERDVPVWRYLPGDAPGTYVDCAVSRCSLRFDGDTSPPTVPLAFTGGGDGPRPPALAVDPSTELAVGDEVMVRGLGFEPGTRTHLSLCAGGSSGADAHPGEFLTCVGGSSTPIDGEGRFWAHFEIPDLGYVEQGMSEECTSDGVCTTSTAGPAMEVRCDESTPCWVIADTYSEDRVTPPIFPPQPVRVTFR
ncbi:MAG: neocarzinostatin apoprotein domain-containing protein, partial [Acidimicrobiales bacterium]